MSDFSFIPPTSVVTIPGANASAAFTSKTSEVFKEEHNIAPIIINDKMKYIPWGGDNQMPYNIIDLIESDETMSTCQMFNAEVCYGSGLVYDTELATAQVQAQVDDFMLDNDLAKYFLGVCQDFKHFGFCVSVIILNEDASRIVRIVRKQACYVRLAPADKSGVIPYILYANWRNTVSPEDIERIELLNPQSPFTDLQTRSKKIKKFAVVSKIPTPDNTYYPIPYYAALFKGKWYNIKYTTSRLPTPSGITSSKSRALLTASSNLNVSTRRRTQSKFHSINPNTMSNLINDNDTLRKYVPNTLKAVAGELSLFDKILYHLLQAEQWLTDTFVSSDTMSRIRTYSDSTPLLHYCRIITAAEAMLHAVPQLDLILTPNGFGIVSNQNVIPASKERIERLLLSLEKQRDDALAVILTLLPDAHHWTSITSLPRCSQHSTSCTNWALLTIPGCDTRTLMQSCSLLSTASKRSFSVRNSWTCFARPTLSTNGI